jgi:hypothetical protein
MNGWQWYGTKGLQVVPFMENTPVYLDGMYSHLYNCTKAEGKIAQLFCGEEKNFGQFVAFFEALKTMQVCCEVTEGGKLIPCGYTWVSNPRGADGARTALCAMCFFAGASLRRSARDLARLALAYAFCDLKIDVLHGIQVVDNYPARNFALRLGFHEVGVVPKYHYINGSLIDARIVMLTAEEFMPKFHSWREKQEVVS